MGVCLVSSCGSSYQSRAGFRNTRLFTLTHQNLLIFCKYCMILMWLIVEWCLVLFFFFSSPLVFVHTGKCEVYFEEFTLAESCMWSQKPTGLDWITCCVCQLRRHTQNSGGVAKCQRVQPEDIGTGRETKCCQDVVLRLHEPEWSFNCPFRRCITSVSLAWLLLANWFTLCLYVLYAMLLSSTTNQSQVDGLHF